jgi:hypothetical protein
MRHCIRRRFRIPQLPDLRPESRAATAALKLQLLQFDYNGQPLCFKMT